MQTETITPMQEPVPMMAGALAHYFSSGAVDANGMTVWPRAWRDSTIALSLRRGVLVNGEPHRDLAWALLTAAWRREVTGVWPHLDEIDAIVDPGPLAAGLSAAVLP